MINIEQDVSAQYMRKVRSLPFLEGDEEFVLAKKWRDSKDPKALNRLVQSHLQLVVKIAHGYAGYGLPLADLIAEGNIGVLNATKSFDPDKGFKFSTYAHWWIKASIQEYILQTWSLVKVGTTAAQKKLFFSLRKLKNQIDLREKDSFMSDEKIEEIATKLSVKKEEVMHMYQRMQGKDFSLNAPLGGSDDSESEWIEWVNDSRDSHEDVILEKNEHDLKSDVFKRALQQLPERDRYVLSSRRLLDEPKTLEDLSFELSISRERVRQIEVAAFEKLKKIISVLIRSEKISF
ncbi:MAG: RNA polymerase sigma factor RpoH [Holosporales bacterium]